MFRSVKKYFCDSTFAGSIFTASLSTLLLFILFGALIRSPNSVYFASSGDGLQSYYGTLFHVLHDTTYARSYGMNHPYGEMVLFTGNQPVIANTIKFISKNIIDISDYTIGIVNIMLLSSIVLAALFIFLIFRHFKLLVLISAVVAVAISFLSPQIGRLGGHFSLSYLFFIPMFMYLFIRFYERRSYWVSVFIFLVTLMAGFTHAYYLGFFGIFFLFYWSVLIIKNTRDFRNPRFFIPHIFLQLILPVLILVIYSAIFDNVTDRTSSPWGILYLRAYPESVFLPYGKPYGKFLERIMTFNHIDWEGWAYIGLIASIGFLVVFFNIIRKIILKDFKSILRVTDILLLNIFFWASFAGLLYSFGLPYILGLEGLLDHLGPLKQLRGIARFSWLFFYMMNILIFYILWKWLNHRKKKVFPYIIWIVSVAFLSYDAWLNSRSMEYFLNNKIPELDDRDNKLPENQWVKMINPNDYQAIIPIPYFHIGSENLWIEHDCNILKHTYIASLKTGLPTTGVLLSRTSIGQSYRNIEMMLEPYRKLEVMTDMPNKKPFLMVVEKCEEINEVEKNLISKSAWLTGNNRFDLYSIQFDTISQLSEKKRDEAMGEFNSGEIIEMDGFLVTDSLSDFYYDGFEQTESGISYGGESCFISSLGEYNTIFHDTLPCSGKDSTLIISFWLGNARNDLVPRSTIEFDLLDSSGKRVSTIYKNLGNLYAILDRNWALLEYSIPVEDPGSTLKITIWNHYLRKEELIVDELLIRPERQSIYKKLEGGIVKNNRYYFE